MTSLSCPCSNPAGRLPLPRPTVQFMSPLWYNMPGIATNLPWSYMSTDHQQQSLPLSGEQELLITLFQHICTTKPVLMDSSVNLNFLLYACDHRLLQKKDTLLKHVDLFVGHCLPSKKTAVLGITRSAAFICQSCRL